jgi:hypothetical protein
MVGIGDVSVGDVSDSIGRVSWFSVRGFEMERAALLALWEQVGLSADDFLAETRAPDAFKQAVKIIEDRYNLDRATGQTTRYLMRSEDGRPHVRHVVREQYRKGEEKPFTFDDVGRFVFNPQNSTMSGIWHSANSQPDETWSILVAAVLERYERLLKTHNDIDVRLALTRKLRSWHCLLLRPTGGVYFIPKTFSEEADKHAAFLSLIGSEMWALPVGSSVAPMVREKLDEHVADVTAAATEKQTAMPTMTDERQKKLAEKWVEDELGRIDDMKNIYGEFC